DASPARGSGEAPRGQEARPRARARGRGEGARGSDASRGERVQGAGRARPRRARAARGGGPGGAEVSEPKALCASIRAKGFYVHTEAPAPPGESSTAVWWCVRTMSSVGPDGDGVCCESCVAA